MPGLIPFMLKPTAPAGNRSSATIQPTHSRCSSAESWQPPRLSPLLPKRLSQPSQPASLPVLPYTNAEWRRAISEIKRQHISRRYRACSARCAEILDNLKDVSHVEPAYLIYLHFYAAASMEMCTRPLPLTSPYRTALLQQARTHYDRATSLITAAEDSVAAKMPHTRSNSASSSRSCSSSSLHSPSGSVSSSRTWTADTSIPSPTNSICSFEDLAKLSSSSSSSPAPSSPRTPPAPKRVKKVSFSLPLCTKAQQDREEAADFRFPEPIIRPDSPTLGFDDHYFHAGAALRDLPLPPPPSKKEEESVPELPLRSEDEDDDEEEAGFGVERSVYRYNETLAHLRAQLASHSVNVGTQLVLSASVADSRPSSPAGSPSSPTFERAAAAADARALDRQARIERLRKTGWARKRFDARRYEEFANEVLAELE